MGEGAALGAGGMSDPKPVGGGKGGGSPSLPPAPQIWSHSCALARSWGCKLQCPGPGQAPAAADRGQSRACPRLAQALSSALVLQVDSDL